MDELSHVGLCYDVQYCRASVVKGSVEELLGFRSSAINGYLGTWLHSCRETGTSVIRSVYPCVGPPDSTRLIVEPVLRQVSSLDFTSHPDTHMLPVHRCPLA